MQKRLQDQQEDEMLTELKTRLEVYLAGNGNKQSLNFSILQSFNQNTTTLKGNQTISNVNQSVSSNATFDLYKLNMTKDMTVLRRTYDRVKFEHKQRKDRLAALEREWDSLHTLNERDNSFKVQTGPAALKKDVTILTADMGTEKRDEIVDLDRLKSHILV